MQKKRKEFIKHNIERKKTEQKPNQKLRKVDWQLKIILNHEPKWYNIPLLFCLLCLALQIHLLMFSYSLGRENASTKYIF